MVSIATRLSIVLLCTTPATLIAQRPQYAEHVWAITLAQPAEGTNVGPGLLGRSDTDHRYTGFYIGLGVGAAATLWSALWCSDPDNGCSVSRSLLLGPVVTGVLGLSGAVVGGLFPKHSSESIQAR